MVVIFNQCILISGSSFRLEKEAIFNLYKNRVFLSQSEYFLLTGDYWSFWQYPVQSELLFRRIRQYKCTDMKRQKAVVCPVLQKTLQVNDHSGKTGVSWVQQPLFEFSEICLGRGFKYFFLLVCLVFFFFVRWRRSQPHAQLSLGAGDFTAYFRL